MDTHSQEQEKVNKNERKVTITFNNKVYNLVATNDCLLQSTLTYNFPNAGRLIWKKDNDTMLLNVKESANKEIYIVLEPGVDNYQFEQIEDSKITKQDPLYESMIDSIKKKCNSTSLKKIPNKTKVMNKSQEEGLSKTDASSELYQKRVIRVSWMHRNDLKEQFVSLGSQIAPKKKIELNGRKDYTLDELEKEIEKQYFDDKNKHYFQGCSSCLANKDGTVIHEFCDQEGEKCSFWAYCKIHRGSSNHALQMTLLTTKLFEKQDENLIQSLITNMPSNQSTKVLYKNNEKIQTLSNQTSIKKDTKHDIIEPRVENISHKNALIDIGNSQQDDKFCAPRNPSIVSTPLKNECVSSKKRDFISYTQSESKEITVGSLPTTSKRLKPEDEAKFAVPTATVKKSKAEIIQTLKLSVPNFQSEQVQISNKILGKGGQGVVRLGLYLGSKVAVKSMSSKTSDKSFLREVHLLSELRHDNIISIRGVCTSDTESHIVMEYFKSVSLHDMIFKNKRDYFTLNVIAKNIIAYQVACAVNYLHSLPVPVIHQDIKPSNILVNRDNKVKLCDFGLGRTAWANTELESTCINSNIRGTHFYMPPEVLVMGNKSCSSSDVWSMGATLVELYSEKTVWPLNSFQSTSMCAQINLLNKNKPIVMDAPTELQESLLQCFEYDPKRRPTAQEMWNVISKLRGCCDLSILTCA